MSTAVATPPSDMVASIPVGLGEVCVTRLEAEPLVAHGLGSCVAVCLFDPVNKVAGLAHVMLPGTAPDNAPNARFAASALPALLEALQQVGGPRDPRRYHARLAGGAHVLAIGGAGMLPRIGDQNVDAVRKALAAAEVPIVAEHVGGAKGRTVWFDPRDNGRIRVKTIGEPEVEL